MKVTRAYFEKNWAWIIVNLFLVFYTINEGIIHSGGEDFRIFLGASKALLNQENLYQKYYDLEPGNVQYAYPIFWAMILIPVQYLPYKLVIFLWLILNGYFINRILKLSLIFVNFINNQIILFFSFLLILRFIMHNYDLSQMTIFWVYLMYESFYSFTKKRKKILPCLLISLGASIKFMPVLFLYYWFVNWKFKLVFFTILLVFLFSISPFLFFNFDYISTQFIDCWKVINPFQSGFNYNLFHNLTQSIPSLVSNYNRILEFNLDEKAVVIINYLLRAVLLLSIYGLYKKFKKERVGNFLFFSSILLSSSLVMPHQQHYSFFSAIGLMVIYIGFIIEKRTSLLSNIFFIISLILMIGTNDLFIPSAYKDSLKEFGVIGLGAISLLISVFFIPKYKSTSTSAAPLLS